MDIFPFLNISTFFFSSPLLLAITFQFPAIPHGRQTPPFLPLSTWLHFACQLLSVVAKVISSVSFLLFLSLSVSLFSRVFSRILPPAVGISFNRRTSHAAPKPAVLPLTPSSQPAPFIKACSARCFFSSTLLLLEVGFTLANPTVSTFIGAPGISLAPFPLVLAP